MESGKAEKLARVLIVSGSEAAAASIADVLPSERFAPAVRCASAAEARERLADGDDTLVVINAPLPDALGPELARALGGDPCRGVLLLLPAEEYQAGAEALAEAGVLTLSKPGSAQLLLQGLNLLLAMRARLAALTQKTRKLELKMEDIRIVNRAKWVLIGQLKMDEAAAHRYIEKQAMNQHRTRREVAESILMTYEA